MNGLTAEQAALIVSMLRNRIALLRRPSDPSHPSRQSADYELAVATLAAVQGRVPQRA